ncbi:MAG: hypothetical protein ACJ8AI_07025 [Rhodopila sp.]
MRGVLCPDEGSARRSGPQAPHCDSRNDQRVRGLRRGREGRGIEPSKHTLGGIEVPNQQQAPGLEIPRMRGIHLVAMPFESRPCRVERFRRPG